MRGGFQFAYVTSQEVEKSLAPVFEGLSLSAWENMGIEAGEEAIGFGAILNFVTLGLHPEPVLRLDSRVAATQWNVLKRKFEQNQWRCFGPLFRYGIDASRTKLASFLADCPLRSGSRLQMEIRNSVERRNASTPAETLLLSLCSEHVKTFLQSDPYSIQNGFRRRVAQCDRSCQVAERSLNYMKEFRNPPPEPKPGKRAIPSGHHQENACVSVRAISAGQFESNRRKF